jgi:rubrerythrin
MEKMTEANVQASFAGESQAHMKYLNFADKAEKEGFPNVARLFQAASYAEQVHASNHLRALDGIQGTVANLGGAIGGETFEVEQMYPAYKAVAEAQGEKKALRFMDWALAAEKVHAKLYAEAKQSVEVGKDVPATDIWVCTSCGFTMDGQPPDKCPVCGVSKDKFRKF